MDTKLLIPPINERYRLFTNLLANQAVSRRTVSVSEVLREETAEARAGSLRARIRRRLTSGRLPYDSVPIIHGAPGVGGACTACDRLLTPWQLVTSVPVKEAFVHLHADCFTIWNALRQSPARLN